MHTVESFRFKSDVATHVADDVCDVCAATRVKETSVSLTSGWDWTSKCCRLSFKGLFWTAVISVYWYFVYFLEHSVGDGVCVCVCVCVCVFGDCVVCVCVHACKCIWSVLQESVCVYVCSSHMCVCVWVHVHYMYVCVWSCVNVYVWIPQNLLLTALTMNRSLQFRPCRLIAMAVCFDTQMVVFLSDSSMQRADSDGCVFWYPNGCFPLWQVHAEGW